jgi:glycosyltransferase 2 family protein
MPRRRRLLVPIAAALGGLVLFSYAVRNVGWGSVVAGVTRVGWGLLPILAVAGLRFLVRAEAWRLCTPRDGRLSLPQAFAAYLAGDSVGNLTPLGLLASEPTKVFLIRHHLATREAAASLAVDLAVYSMSAVAMVAAGLLVLLAAVPLAAGWQQAIVAIVVALVAGVAGAVMMLKGTRLRPLFDFSGGHPGRLWRVFLLDAVFHLLATIEVWITLGLLMDEGPTLPQAIIFSALDRAVTIAFKFVPFRIGVDEASAGGMAALLGWPPAVGVALAVVKKVRSLAWVSVGLALIAAHPARAGRATDPPGSAPAHPT